MHSLNLIFAAGLASAATIRIDAGPGLYFKPESVTAQQGDVLEFHFLPINHSVAMGDFNNPCQMPATGGFFSGYLPTKEGEASDIFRVTVNNADPIWLYCTQNIHTHCKGGMVGVINPPTSMGNMTLDAYKAASVNFNGMAGDRVTAFGGELTKASSTSSGGVGNGSGTSNGGGSSSGSENSSPAKSAGNTNIASIGLMGTMAFLILGLA